MKNGKTITVYHLY